MMFFMSIACLADFGRPAGQRDTDALRRHRFDSQCAALNWPYHFPRGLLAQVILHADVSVNMLLVPALPGHRPHLTDETGAHAAILRPPLVPRGVLIPCARHNPAAGASALSF